MDRRIKWILAIGISGLFLVSALNSCGGGGGGDGGDGGTQIQSVEDGAAAAGAGTAGATAGGAISGIVSNLGNLTNAALVKPSLSKPTNPLVTRSPRHAKMVAMAKTVAESGVIQKAVASLKAAKSRTGLADIPGSGIPSECPGTGFATFTGTVDDAGNFDVNIQCDQCRNGAGGELDGPITSTGSSTLTGLEFTMILGDEETDFSVLTYTDDTYQTLLSDFAANLEVIETLSVSLTSFTLKANGTAKFNDLISGVTSLELTNFRDEGSTSDTESDDTLNGSVEESWTDSDGSHTLLVKFNDFNTHVEQASDGSSDVSYDGKVTTDFEPGEEDCPIEGGFNFDTDPEDPLHFGPTDSCPVSGRLVINGNTDIVYSDGSVDVSVDDGPPTSYTCTELEAFCEVEAIE